VRASLALIDEEGRVVEQPDIPLRKGGQKRMNLCDEIPALLY